MTPPIDEQRAAEQLYAGPPAEFTARRDALAETAKAAGDRDTAAAIRRLRKPTVAAWLLNLLVREHRDEVEPFVALGGALREATATMSGPQLKELSSQRHRLVQALVARARALGQARGQRVGEDALRGVEETLTAALADPGAADALLSGRLTSTLSADGFGTAAVPPVPPRRATARRQSAADPQREARVAAAWAAAREAAEQRDRLVAEEEAAEAAATSAQRDLEAAREAVSRLTRDLEAAQTQLSDAERARETAVAARKELAGRRRAAAAAADKARKELSTLQES